MLQLKHVRDTLSGFFMAGVLLACVYPQEANVAPVPLWAVQLYLIFGVVIAQLYDELEYRVQTLRIIFAAQLGLLIGLSLL